jgi:hypothetical protein
VPISSPSRPPIRPLSDDVRFDAVRRRSTAEPPVKRDASVALLLATPSTTRFHPFTNRFHSFTRPSLRHFASATIAPAFCRAKTASETLVVSVPAFLPYTRSTAAFQLRIDPTTTETSACIVRTSYNVG